MLKDITTLVKPSDFDAFWTSQIKKMKSMPQTVTWISEEHLDDVIIKRFSCLGFTNNKIYGYVLMPTKGENFPCVVTHHGYMYHAGHYTEHLHFVEDGYMVVAYDFRGQSGSSRDDFIYHSGDHHLMTKGIKDIHEYYMMHVYMDALRIVDVARHFEKVNPKYMISHGGSQGGGVALAVAALDSQISLTLADVPSYSYLPGRLETRNGSIAEIAQWIDQGHITQENALKTLSYIDLVHHASRIQSPVIISTGGKDMICPEAYFMPTYEAILTEKSLYQYPEAGHEGGGDIHLGIKREWIKEHIREHQQLDQNTHN
jgi:cephalosporin-C deacetylase